MHIIRLDIDRKNSAEHLQVGPLGCGLNAVYSTAAAGSATMARFIKGLLFRGHSSNDLNYDNDAGMEDAGTVDGSLQWADATGHVRLMSYSGGSPLLPSKFIHSPLHPSERPIHADERDHVRGIGNIFWEGDEQDGRWDELRGDILGMVFCSPLGTVSPEKLWWAASRLGVHSAAKSQLDEGYQRLKSEEQELLDKLRNSENVDHDRAWWSIERDRIAAELAHISNLNHNAAEKAERCCEPCSGTTTERSFVPERNSVNDRSAANERLVSIQLEIARLRTQQQESLVNEANAQFHENRTESLKVHSGTNLFNNVSLHNEAFGRSKSTSNRAEFVAERQRIQQRIDQLLVEQANVESAARFTGPQIVPQTVTSTYVTHTTKRWDDTHLRQQHAHAEEMLSRWDRRAQLHRRLAEVQSHLRTRSPYRRTTEGSLIPAAEKFLRELTSGATRQLPPWAIEASYLNHHLHAPHMGEFRNVSGYRNEYYDNSLPSENTRQRKLVDLAIRLAIAQAAVPRIGRIPMLLDDNLGGFRGESLEQILHVLSSFSRDGRQLILATNDEYVARRVAAHGGAVSRMLEVLRYARPSYVLDSQSEIGLHPAMDQSAILAHARDSRPLRIVSVDSPEHEIRELNRQLTGLANEQANHSWWLPNGTRMAPQPQYVEKSIDLSANGRRFHLQMDSLVQDAPGVSMELQQRLNAAGIYRVADLLRVHSSRLGATIRVDAAILEQIQRVAELMCATPQLRPFDAQVLVGCGITRSDALRSMPTSELVRRVESYLATSAGQDLLRGATSFEVARIRTWIADMRRSYSSRTREEVVPIRADRTRNRERVRRARRESSYDARPRIVRSNDDGSLDEQVASFRESEQFSVSGRAGETYSDPQRSAAARVQRASSSGQVSSSRSSSSRASSARSSSTHSGQSGSQWKFYLDIDSPIVDAPSIGPRMAERLAPLNILSVGDLVAINPDMVASQLADRAVTAETVHQWQQQALLVCRVPNLRGHDAQLIVGCGLTTAEQLAASDSADLFNKVIRFASSKHGVRILRGSNAPDQQEVTDWIQWAQNCRAVRAA